MLLIIIPLLLAVSFVFYTIATLDGAVFGTPQGEVDSIVEEKLAAIAEEAEKAVGAGSSSTVGNTFERIVFALKLIPNMADHKDLMKTMVKVGGPESGYTGLEDSVDYDTAALGDQSTYPRFFEWNGAHQLNFPEMVFDANHVPMGNSVRMCLGVQWAMWKKRKMYDKYIDIQGFQDCTQSISKRTYMEPDYPQTGLNFHLWDQHKARGDSVCSNGIYREDLDICFTYHVMKQVCLLMKYVKNTETNSYAWVYTGGCFKDNKPVWYVDAIPGETYNFKDVQFEIREDQRDLENLSFENVDLANADEDAKSGTTEEENGEEDDDETPEEAAER